MLATERCGVTRGDGERPSVSQESVDFVKRALSGLREVNSILVVSDGLLKARDLRPKVLGDDKACRIIGG
ncbi:MAG TPA: hypothetical protein PKA27_12210 [Fimbriimonadaceae bacterium]|nr:hypothetical protein [Fimbriimonadaceae bacterium]